MVVNCRFATDRLMKLFNCHVFIFFAPNWLIIIVCHLLQNYFKNCWGLLKKKKKRPWQHTGYTRCGHVDGRERTSALGAPRPVRLAEGATQGQACRFFLVGKSGTDRYGTPHCYQTNCRVLRWICEPIGVQRYFAHWARILPVERSLLVPLL